MPDTIIVSGIFFIKKLNPEIYKLVNVSILTNLLIKLMKFLMVFFETKTTGDIMQRMISAAKAH